MLKKRHTKRTPRVAAKRVNIRTYAKILQSRMTKAEVLLWKHLQYSMIKWDVVFESQGVVAARYIADFICRSKRLIVEVDGSVHKLTRVRINDRRRTVFLTSIGFTVIRFSNSDVLNNVSKVLSSIRSRIERVG